MLSNAVMERLGLIPGHKRTLTIITAKGIPVSDTKFRLVIVTLDRTYSEKICAATVEDPAGHLIPTNWNKYKAGWSYMKDIKFLLENGNEVKLLLGSDYGFSIRGLKKIHRHNSREPILKLTPLGWTATGPLIPCQLHRDEETH